MSRHRKSRTAWQRTLATALIVVALFVVAFAIGAALGPRLIGSSGTTVQQQAVTPTHKAPSAPEATWSKPKVEITLKGKLAPPSGDTTAVIDEQPETEQPGQTEEAATPPTPSEQEQAPDQSAGSQSDKPPADSQAKPATDKQKPEKTPPETPEPATSPDSSSKEPTGASEPPASTSETSTTTWYKVRIGPFGSVDLAKQAQKDLKSKGIDSIRIGKLHLQAGAFKTEKGALTLKQQLEQYGYPATITKE